MKTKHIIPKLTKVGLVLSVCFSLSCSENRINEDSEELELQSNLSLSAKSSCNEKSFPKLGPSAAKGQVSGCDDEENPINIGTLDCRSPHDFGGYKNDKGYGRYRITGDNQKFDGTRTRVERFFNSLSLKKEASTILSYTFIMDEVSSGATCIVQAHAVGEIVDGLKKEKTARSAVFLLYVSKTNRKDKRGKEIYELNMHESTIPFTTDTGSAGAGKRTVTPLRNITQGVEYKLTYEAGYDKNSMAFSEITVSGGGNTESKRLQHSFTAEAMTTRYGLYESCDSCSDNEVQIRIKDTKMCRETGSN
jgi:hypothetical protein